MVDEWPGRDFAAVLRHRPRTVVDPRAATAAGDRRQGAALAAKPIANVLPAAESGAHGPSIAALTEVTFREPHNDQAFRRRGDAYAKAGDLDNARADYDLAIRLADPPNVENHLARAKVLLTQGHLDRAALDYTAALEVDPQCIEAYYQRGQIYRRLNDLAAAAADFPASRGSPRAIRAASSRWAKSRWRRENSPKPSRISARGSG